MVNTTADEVDETDNLISLREAIVQASDSTTIRFDPSIFTGQVTDAIVLTGEQLLIDKSIIIDASEIPRGVAIDANGRSRIIDVRPGATLSLHALTLTGGRSDNGGAIRNDNATLTLNNCTLSSNFASFRGGGVFNDGRLNLGNAALILNNCTLADNSSDTFGGGIFNNGDNGSVSLTLNNSTLSENSANAGGGIFNEGSNGSSTLNLNNCTLSGNSASGTLAEGGGIINNGSINGNATLNLNNTILAGNTALNGSDLRENAGSTIIPAGHNLLSSTDGHSLDDSASEIMIIAAADLQLAPLGHYGGPTQTMPPLPDSPAIDAGGSVNPLGSDQRNFDRFVGGVLDIGAVEFQGETEEILNGFNADVDSDGVSTGVELAIGTQILAADPSDEGHLRLMGIGSDGSPQLSFGLDDEQQNNIILRLTRSTDLVNFTEIMSNEDSNFLNPGTGLLEIGDSNPPVGGRAFYRLEAELRPKE